jgi:RNA ligase
MKPEPEIPAPVIHPARLVEFDELIAGLDAGVAAGAIYERSDDGLSIFHYSNRCVYDLLWTPSSLMARGLILDRAARRIVATPFPKFFNFSEPGVTQPIPTDEPFETFEKLDGSLGIVFHHAGQWKVTTKGAFGTPQALWAESRLAGLNLDALRPGDTYLFEIVSKENRIVVAYPFEELVLLGGYSEDGREFVRTELETLADHLGCRIAAAHRFADFDELFAAAGSLGRLSEGFVVRFERGLRLKLKGAEYCRIHRLVSRVTPLGLYEMLEAGDDPETVRRMIPEEFLEDFDRILELLRRRLAEVTEAVEAAFEKTRHLSDRDIGLALSTMDELSRMFLFSRRKFGPEWTSNSKSRGALFRWIRPKGDELPGYVPSSTVARIRGEN